MVHHHRCPFFGYFRAIADLLIFWSSGKTKLGDSIISPSFGYDASLKPNLDTLLVLAGTYAEFALPTLIALGLFTRLASVGMIGFIAMMSYVDVTGHNAYATTIGQMFDRLPYGIIMDQRLLWVFVLMVVVVKGAGPLSVDRILTSFRK